MKIPFLAAALGLCVAAHSQIYVSPAGSDAASGDRQHPVRTVEHARDLVRLRNQGMTADITVTLAPGTYRLARALAFDARDSGTHGHKVIYTSSGAGEPAIIAGAVRVEGWKLADRQRNLWSAPAPQG